MRKRGFGVSVTDFGADPMGKLDSTPAFKAAIVAVAGRPDPGGIVFVPQGTYLVNETLNLPAFVSLCGESRSTTLDFSGQASGSAIVVLGYGNLSIERLQIWNPAGNGVEIGSAHDGVNRNFCNVSDVHVREVRSADDRGPRGGSGFRVQNAFLLNFARCQAEGMRDYGFYFLGYHTTVKLENCDASAGLNTGYYLIGMTYSSLINCGSDSNQGYGYFLANCQGVSMVSCGAEQSYLSSVGMAASQAWADDWHAIPGLGELRGITLTGFCSIRGNTSGDANYGDYLTLNADGKTIQGVSFSHFAHEAPGTVVQHLAGSGLISFPILYGSHST